ncbi:MAG TPA: BON domain-containing protein [Usitatibacter sp.]|nr:BON domain-containing protein [Usitatibacter sp.]
MKDFKSLGRLAVVAAALAAAPALAHDDGRWHAFRSDSHQGTWHGRLDTASNAIHAGATNASDQALAEAVADVFERDPALFGATATIAANNGRVMLSGSSKNVQQSMRAEQDARRVAGVTSVSGTLDPMGG